MKRADLLITTVALLILGYVIWMAKYDNFPKPIPKAVIYSMPVPQSGDFAAELKFSEGVNLPSRNLLKLLEKGDVCLEGKVVDGKIVEPKLVVTNCKPIMDTK